MDKVGFKAIIETLQTDTLEKIYTQGTEECICPAEDDFRTYTQQPSGSHWGRI